MQTRVVPYDNRSIEEAARLILDGQPVAVPTETVYGLAADATNAEAVARIYEAKGRPSFNPLIVHVPALAAAEQIGEFGAEGWALAEEHWPGPLTLVVPLRADAGIASIVTAGLPTIGLRVPAHPAMQALLRATGRPLAAPSANASGGISPTRAAHVLKSLGGRVPLIIDGGATQRGIEIDHCCSNWRHAPPPASGSLGHRRRDRDRRHDRGAGPARQPLRAVETAPAQCRRCRAE